MTLSAGDGHSVVGTVEKEQGCDLATGVAAQSGHPARHTDVVGRLAADYETLTAAALLNPGHPPMKVSDVMSGAIEFLPGEATAKEAAELMGELDVGALPVGTATSIDGLVTDRDILFRVVAAGRDPSTVQAGEITSRPAITCEVGDPLQTAMDLMIAHHIRRLPVRDDKGRVVGIVTLADVARKLLVDSDTLQTALSGMTEAAG